jgi:transcriptional regulator with XRE-family HTH domain
MISGKQLRLLRIDSGQTQTQLAEKLGKGGYSQQVVAAIENDKRNIGLWMLGDWANACGYDVQISFMKQGTVEDLEVSDVELPKDFV